MSKLVVRAFSISLDGYGAGPDQSLEHPLGVGGHDGLFPWLFATRTQRQMLGQDGGDTGIDDFYARRSFENIGAWIMGRYMFGPIRGPWSSDEWRGWWGSNPPFHAPVYVLTRQKRRPIEMEGGTTFHFVTDGIKSALKKARAAAGDKDIRVGGGVATVQQFLHARLIDEMHVAISPVLLGSGENLYAGIDLKALGYVCTSHEASAAAVHIIYKRAD